MHRYKSIEVIWLSAGLMMPAQRTRVNRRLKTGGPNQAPGSALMRADKRDSLRPTVLA
jgi:hypothetical protein